MNALLTTGDAAKLLAITPRGVRWLAQVRLLSSTRTLSGRWLFRQDQVLAMVRTRALRRHPALRSSAPSRLRVVRDPEWRQLVLPFEYSTWVGDGSRSRRKLQMAKAVLPKREVKVVAFPKKRAGVA
jgi:hypothetical protein